jgi:hypothetical protein
MWEYGWDWGELERKFSVEDLSEFVAGHSFVWMRWAENKAKAQETNF